jgi:DNA-directed RNA polymerase subunit RPC12/RpoP
VVDATPPTPSFRCAACGAAATFSPDAGAISCAHCGTTTSIDAGGPPVVEEDLLAALEAGTDRVEAEERVVHRCNGCGAETTLPEGVTACACAFCGAPIVAVARQGRLLRPKALLPFRIPSDDAIARFRAWVGRRWFAPNDFRAWARDPGTLVGTYVPFWTFDARTTTAYVGQRGDTYTVTVGEGKQRRTETRTRWSLRWGSVDVGFDDLLVPATDVLPPALAEKLEPWDLDALVPYADAYLGGFRALSYRTGLGDAFATAKRRMETDIDRAVREDIGGDRQQVHRSETRWDGLSFKHVLLPVWSCSYRYRSKHYPVLVNARTGEVQGARPWSAWKIVLALLAVAAAIAAIVLAARVGSAVEEGRERDPREQHEQRRHDADDGVAVRREGHQLLRNDTTAMPAISRSRRSAVNPRTLYSGLASGARMAMTGLSAGPLTGL